MKGQAEVYALFAAIFAKEPTLELLRHSAEGFDLLSDLKHLEPAQQVEALSIEYTRLFVTPAQSTSPRESMQLGEGRLWGNSTVEVNKIYKEFGFELDPGFKDTPDHLSAELAFLAELSKLESKYEDKGLKEAKEGVLKVKKYFLKNHIFNWFPTLKKKIEKQANVSYYKEIARLLHAVLDHEMENLNEAQTYGTK